VVFAVSFPFENVKDLRNLYPKALILMCNYSAKEDFSRNYNRDCGKMQRLET
jgi:hypothetical protein